MLDKTVKSWNALQLGLASIFVHIRMPSIMHALMHMMKHTVYAYDYYNYVYAKYLHTIVLRFVWHIITHSIKQIIVHIIMQYETVYYYESILCI